MRRKSGSEVNTAPGMVGGTHTTEHPEMACLVDRDGIERVVLTDAIDPARLRRQLITLLIARGLSVSRVARVFRVTRLTVYRELERIDPDEGHRILDLA